MSAILRPYLGIILTALIPTSVILVLYYAEQNFPWHTYLTLVIGYYASFGILLLVPIDIASVIIDRRSTSVGSDSDYNYDKDTLSAAYDTFFTIILIMGSFILVFEEYFNTDGYFTIGGKIASAFKRMTVDTIAGVVAGVIILGILLGQHVLPANSDALQLAAIIVTNTVYEAFLMFLLGYSLIEYPRDLWSKSNLDAYLLKVQMKAACDFKDISEAQLSVSLEVANVLKTKSQLSAYADQKLNDAMEILIRECPPEFRSDRMGKVATNKSGQITIDTLAELRTKLNSCKDKYRMAQAKVEGTKILAYNLEDIVQAKNTAGTTVIHWSLLNKDSTEFEYKKEIIYKPWFYRIATVIASMLSILSFLGVICSMHGVSNNASPYYLIVHGDQATAAGITIFILITLGYTAYVINWALFQMKIAGSMVLVPRRTTPESLSFNVRMCARLAAPLAFFYLGWISENGIKSGNFQDNNAPPVTMSYNESYFNATTNSTSYSIVNFTTDDAIFMPSAFSNFYQLQSVGAIQSTFGTIFPVLLFCVMALFLTNVFNRILVMIKMSDYQFGAEIVTEEQLREGKRQLQRHKKTTERAYRRNDLRNFILNIGRDDDEPGLLGRLMGRGKKSDTSAKSKDPVERPTIKEPAPLSAPLERKGAHSMGISAGWKPIYAEVRSPGYLHLYKDLKSCRDAGAKSTEGAVSHDPTATVVDLKLVMDFKVPPKKNKESLELDLEMSEDTVRLKFKTIEDVEQWKNILQEWKDFNIDYGNIYPNGLAGGAVGDADIESGGRSTSSSSLSNPVANKLTSSSATHGNINRDDAADLDAIQVDDDGGDDSGNNNRGSSFSPFKSGGLFSKKKQDTSSAPSKSMADDKPASLEGWLDKKGHGKVHMGGDWQKRYLKVDENSGCLTYSKSSNPNETPAGTIDLKSVKDITPYDKGGKTDYSRFNVDYQDKVYKFKATTDAEGKKWVDGLNEWKDYFLLNMR